MKHLRLALVLCLIVMTQTICAYSITLQPPLLDSVKPPPPQTPEHKTIAIIATNDIHGSVMPAVFTHPITHEQYSSGGLTYLASMIQTLRAQYGKHNVLFLDAGDQFEGSLESRPEISGGKLVRQFFDHTELSASSIGNHEFDWGPELLSEYMRKRRGSFLAANIFTQNADLDRELLSQKQKHPRIGDQKELQTEIKTTGSDQNLLFKHPQTNISQSKKKRESSSLPNSEHSKIFHMAGGLKIGVVGLATVQTPSTTSGFMKHKFPEYVFQNYTDILIRESKSLRQKGVHAVVLLGHLGTRCPNASLTHQIWTNQTHQPPCDSDELTTLLASLPEGTVDAVIQGHRHETAHFFEKGIPVAGSKNGGRQFNVVYLTFDKTHKKIVSRLIEGPIPVCQKVFSRTKRCNFIDNTEKARKSGDLMSWKFHGKTVESDIYIDRLLRPYESKLAPYMEALADNKIYLSKIKRKDCLLCNLVADMVLNSTDANFSIINLGVLRSIWIPGTIRIRDVEEMIPFDNKVVRFQITGLELKKLLEIAYAKQWDYGVSRLKLTVSTHPRKLVNVSMIAKDATIKNLQDDKVYRGVTTDFLLQGGDGFAESINKHQYVPRNTQQIGLVRQIVKEGIRKLGSIDQDSIGSAKESRIQFIN